MPIRSRTESNGGSTKLRVRIQPKASRNAVRWEDDGALRITLTAPPIDGKANEALVAFLAKCLGVPKRNVHILSGEKSRNKTLEIDGLDQANVEGRLRSLSERG